MNAEWLGVRPVRRLPARGRVGDHVTTPDGRLFARTSRHGWVQVWPAPPEDEQEKGRLA
jgi:hypothetical protein